MSDSAYVSERLMAQLDGARLVRYDAAGLVYAWFGGHGVHAYAADGAEVDYWNVGDFARSDADPADVERSMAERILRLDEILEQAEQEGYDHGVTAGSWVLDGNSTEEAARRLLRGIEDGDPEILDALPSSPLSGEWAGGATPADVLAWYSLDEEHDAAGEVLDAFERGYNRGVEDQAAREARSIFA